MGVTDTNRYSASYGPLTDPNKFTNPHCSPTTSAPPVPTSAATGYVWVLRPALEIEELKKKSVRHDEPVGTGLSSKIKHFTQLEQPERGLSYQPPTCD